MKIKFLSAVPVLLIVLSCHDDAPAPVKSRQLLPLRMELEDYTREFLYDDNHRISKIKTSSFFPGEVVLESTTGYFYDDEGQLEKVETDSGFRLDYTWEGGRIIRTDQYINDQPTEHYTFLYDEKGRLREYTTWQDIPEEGGLIPVQREVYLYDNRDNVTTQFLYYYDSGIKGHALLSSFEFADYDDHKDGEGLFDAYTINPGVVRRKNNPGKMVTRNRTGNAVMVDEYSYVYNADGYPIEKTTTGVFSYNGSGGSYRTRYYYEIH